MSSITMWHRLEPRARSTDMTESLAARVYDPLWFLGRQWQLGEFEGEDGGSAVKAHLRGTASSITRLRMGGESAAWQALDPNIPLETQVEAEPFRSATPTTRDAAEAGLMWLSMLGQKGFGSHRLAYLTHAPLAVTDTAADGDDTASQNFRGVLGGRVPDGAALFSEFDAALRPEGGGPGALPPTPDLGDDREAVETVARAWLHWWDTYAAEPREGESAWMSSQLEYRFAIAAPSDDGREVVLEAEEYTGGHLDWYAFRRGDMMPGTTPNSGAIETIERTVTPSPVEIPGNPASRFWEFEDGLVDFARLEAGPEDIALLLHAEFGLLYGDDWLLVPLDLAVGTVFKTDVLEVEDTFGTHTSVSPTTDGDDPEAGWGFFHLSNGSGAATARRRPDSLFLVPHVLVSSLEGVPVEEVLLLRDEMANLAWAVERRTESTRGRSVDRAKVYQQRRAQVEEVIPTSEAGLRYQMHGRVPDYWIPFMPQRQPGSTREVRLQRGSVRDPETGDFHRPIGRILVPDEPLFIDEEQAMRAGLYLTRAAQYARSSDGGVHLWMSRRKRLGRREGSSGLRFDQITSVDESSE